MNKVIVKLHYPAWEGRLLSNSFICFSSSKIFRWSLWLWAFCSSVNVPFTTLQNHELIWVITRDWGYWQLTRRLVKKYFVPQPLSSLKSSLCSLRNLWGRLVASLINWSHDKMNPQGTKIYNSNMSLITEAQFNGKWNKKSPTRTGSQLWAARSPAVSKLWVICCWLRCFSQNYNKSGLFFLLCRF